jgi:hypothetical protein
LNSAARWAAACFCALGSGTPTCVYDLELAADFDGEKGLKSYMASYLKDFSLFICLDQIIASMKFIFYDRFTVFTSQ